MRHRDAMVKLVAQSSLLLEVADEPTGAVAILAQYWYEEGGSRRMLHTQRELQSLGEGESLRLDDGARVTKSRGKLLVHTAAGGLVAHAQRVPAFDPASVLAEWNCLKIMDAKALVGKSAKWSMQVPVRPKPATFRAVGAAVAAPVHSFDADAYVSMITRRKLPDPSPDAVVLCSLQPAHAEAIVNDYLETLGKQPDDFVVVRIHYALMFCRDYVDCVSGMAVARASSVPANTIYRNKYTRRWCAGWCEVDANGRAAHCVPENAFDRSFRQVWDSILKEVLRRLVSYNVVLCSPYGCRVTELARWLPGRTKHFLGVARPLGDVLTAAGDQGRRTGHFVPADTVKSAHHELYGDDLVAMVHFVRRHARGDNARTYDEDGRLLDEHRADRASALNDVAAAVHPLCARTDVRQEIVEAFKTALSKNGAEAVVRGGGVDPAAMTIELNRRRIAVLAEKAYIYARTARDVDLYEPRSEEELTDPNLSFLALSYCKVRFVHSVVAAACDDVPSGRFGFDGPPFVLLSMGAASVPADVFTQRGLGELWRRLWDTLIGAASDSGCEVLVVDDDAVTAPFQARGFADADRTETRRAVASALSYGTVRQLVLCSASHRRTPQADLRDGADVPLVVRRADPLSMAHSLSSSHTVGLCDVCPARAVFGADGPRRGSLFAFTTACADRQGRRLRVKSDAMAE